MTSKPILSVIIGIRDWDLRRLRVAINSHKSCTIAEDVEVVISDYGSENRVEIEDLAVALGCTYIYSDADLWSRARALNAGIVASRGEYILATDADIIFAPNTHEVVVEYLKKYPNSLQLKQCRDLPESITLDDLETVDWDYLNRIGQTRPRWGMGGLSACRRDMADQVRGYDERMVIWGAEDNDFGKRMRDNGAILHWMPDDAAQIYHVWHSPFLHSDPNAASIFEKNKTYLNDDHSIIRNLEPGAIYRGRAPLVSVVVATKNRSSYLYASIQSVLNQTFDEFELIVIDDGSTDGTQDMLDKLSDPRIRRIRNEKSLGVAGARNKANATARGKYIVVHDDDDLMMPRRLEKQLGAIKAGIQGAYGGWIDFHTDTYQANFIPGKRPFNLPSIAFSGEVLLHPTLMAEKRVFDHFPYHESFSGGSDYNVAFRMAWNQVRLEHCESYVTLRRLHSANMTSTSNNSQKMSSQITTSVFLNGLHNTTEKDIRTKSKSTEVVPIKLELDEFRKIRELIPIAGVTEIVEMEPRLAKSYLGSENVLLGGRVVEDEFEVRYALRSSDDSPANQLIDDPDMTDPFCVTSREAQRFIAFSKAEFTINETYFDAAEIYGPVAACELSKQKEWVLIDIDERNTLVDALKSIEYVLPPQEDMVVICRDGFWSVAFANQPPLRKTVLKRKLNLRGSKSRLHIIQVAQK